MKGSEINGMYSAEKFLLENNWIKLSNEYYPVFRIYKKGNNVLGLWEAVISEDKSI